MKIQFSLPTNEAFFNRYATLIPTLSKLGVIAQLISALTEVGIIYSIIFSRVQEIAPNNAHLFAMMGAIVGTAFLEVGLRKFTPYSINAFLYGRFKGLDLAMTFFILLVCGGLFFASGTLSFKGSKELVEIAAPKAELKTTVKTDLDFHEKKREVNSIFSADSTTVANGYGTQMAAETSRFNSLIAQQKTKLNRYARKEQATGESYQTRKEQIKGKIVSLKVEQSNKVAQLEAAKATELKELLQSRRADLKAFETTYTNDKSKIENANTATIAKAESSVSFYGNGLAWFTIICLCVFLFSVVLEQIHKKGSGVEQVAQPNQYHFSQSIFAEFTNMTNDKLNYYFRNKIQVWAQKTPPPPVPTAPPSLYDLTDAKQQRLLFSVADAGEQRYLLNNNLPPLEASKAQKIEATASRMLTNANISEPLQDLEPIILQYLQAYLNLKNCELDKEAEQMDLKAEQVIKAYLGENATAKGVTELKADIIGFLEGKNPNPFAPHHRKPIGFKPSVLKNEPLKPKTVKDPIRKSYNDNRTDPNQRACVHCKQPYIYRHHKQKYCTDKCRIDAWELRTGKALKLKKKK